MTPEDFRHCQWAFERGALNSQQSLMLYESSKEIIDQSRRLMEALRNPQPTYKAGAH